MRPLSSDRFGSGTITGDTSPRAARAIDLFEFLQGERGRVEFVRRNRYRHEHIEDRRERVHADRGRRIRSRFLLTKQTNDGSSCRGSAGISIATASGLHVAERHPPEDSVASIVGRGRTIGGAVGSAATWLKPGFVAHLQRCGRREIRLRDRRDRRRRPSAARCGERTSGVCRQDRSATTLWGSSSPKS